MDNLDNTLHFSEGEVAIQKGGSNLSYKYEPSTNARGRTVAYEYAFHNPMLNVTQAISLKSIDDTGVTLSYAYSTSKLTSITSSNTQFETQEVAPDGSRYIYILVTLSTAMPTNFQSNVVWNQGLLGSVTLNYANGTTSSHKMVKGQILNNLILPIESATTSGYQFEGWYADENCSKEVSLLGATQGGINIYSRVGNLPTDWLALDSSTNTYYVKRGTSALPSKLIIPAYYNGKKVANIQVGSGGSEGVFASAGVTSVSLPNSMESVGNWAFYNCTSLQYVNIPTQLENLGFYSFYGCTALDTNIYENGVYLPSGENDYCALLWNTSLSITSCNIYNETEFIYTGAFYECSQLTSITIPSTVKQIGGYAFYNCTSLISADLSACDKLLELQEYTFANCTAVTTIKLNNNITKIGPYCFDYCRQLSSLNLPTSLKVIGASAFHVCGSLTFDLTMCPNLTNIESWAFDDCSGIRSITIPKSVIYIGLNPFTDCSGLRSITVEEGNSIFYAQNNALINKNSNTLITGLATTVIPQGVKVIGNSAFLSNVLTSASYILPDSVMKIDNRAFMSSHIVSVTLSSNITTIGEYAFAVSGITEIDLSVCTKLTSIGAFAFQECASLTSVILPSSLTQLIGGLFYKCSALTSIDLSRCTNVTYMGGSVFDSCTSLVSIDLSNTKLTTINSYGFYGCGALERVKLPSTITGIYEYAFTNCNQLKVLEGLENTKLEEIGVSAFQNCNHLTIRHMPSTIKTIGAGAFASSDSINIDFSNCNQLTSIGDNAFYGCGGVKSITIPTSVTYIGNNAFYMADLLWEVYNLSNLQITKGDTANGYVGYYAKAVHTSANATSIYVEIDNLLYYVENENNYTCVGPRYKDEDVSNIVIDSRTTYITGFIFTNVANIDFSECANLTTINGFGGCYYLNSIDLSMCTKLTTIKDWAFHSSWTYDETFTSIILPSSVTKIGIGVFQWITELNSITIQGADTGTWYVTPNEDYTGGEAIDLTNPNQNASYFKSTYAEYYFYKAN